MIRLFKTKNSSLIIILIIGLIIRLAFLLVGAEYYFGRENIFVNGDTNAWRLTFINLIEQGTYSVNLDNEYGFFGRMPGYSFFMGFFYFISGKNWDLAYQIIGWFQTLLDVVNIYLIYLATRNIFNKSTAIVASISYATYPFIIVWNPVVYSELISIFFMLLSIYFITLELSKKHLLLVGIFISFAVLNRPQIILLVPCFYLFIFFKAKFNIKVVFKPLLILSLPILLIYGSWPLRNYVNHDKIILTQHLGGFKNWDVDVISFLNYIYSVKAEWDPQFTSIIENQTTIFPEIAYEPKEDSLLLEKAILLSKTCGSGFSNWRGYWKETIEQNNCNEEIATIFNHLRENQIKNHPLNFYLIIPLQNLKKALFKFKQNNTTSMVALIASSLFVYRTILILLGLIGVIYMWKANNQNYLLFGIYFLLLYGALCFGTSTQFRNIEMRYFLPADILLLIPSAYFIVKLKDKLMFNNKND